MKFLLVAVNAKYIHSNPAIYSLRAYAGEKLQQYIELAEYTINNYTQDILADIYKRKPDVIGLSCYIWNWNIIQELIVELPKVLPDTDIWLGGPEVSFNALEILEEYPGLTGIMVGEGEATFKELLEKYVIVRENNGSALNKQMWEAELQSCAGLCLPSGYTSVREVSDMNKLPFLYNDLQPFENRIIYYESSRGCPYRCSYCLSSIEKTVRLRDMEVVKKELQFFLDNKVKQVKFVDRTFNCNHDHAMAIWRYIHEHDNGVTNFHFEISADILREDEIVLLNQLRPGLVQLEIGVQSTNPDTIKGVNRVMNVERLENIVSSIYKANNIHQHLDLIAGLPYEDYESFGKSFNRVYGMKPQQLQLGFLKVLKGSEMHVKAKEYGICYLDKPPYEVLYTNWLTYDDVLRLKKIEEMVELYYNSNQFTHTLPFLERVFESPFAMYEAMADFYDRKGYFVNSPARSYRYEILLQFAKEYDGENEEIYKELLTYDMYLRENLKSRPVFAREISAEDKEFIRNAYQKEEQERKFLPSYEKYDWKQLSKMTHIEGFNYPVWDMENIIADALLGQCREQGCGYSGEKNKQYILFDYSRRNPLNYEAYTQAVK